MLLLRSEVVHIIGRQNIAPNVKAALERRRELFEETAGEQRGSGFGLARQEL